MQAKRERNVLGFCLLIFLLILSFPYLYAHLSAGPDQVFGGILFNPLDGNSYLAKMRQGQAGAWQFVLPYSAEPGAPAPLNLYYLFLGHLSRWTGWSLIGIFHLARLLGSACLFLMIFRLCSRIFENRFERWAAFLLASFGSGLGWLTLLFGVVTPDFWLSEAYPFHSALANAHFPMGIALQIFLLTPTALDEKRESLGTLTNVFLASAAISIIYPFGLVLSGFILLFQVLAQRQMGVERRDKWQHLVAIGLSGAPTLLVQWWSVRIHPALSQWNAQNVTPSPNIFLLVLALSPALIVSLCFFQKWLERRDKRIDLLLLWLFVGLLLAYFPSNLQRRFLSGIFIPIALLSVWTIAQWNKESSRKTTLLLLILVSIPSQFILLLSGMAAIRDRDKSIYISREMMGAMAWLDERAETGALVAAAPESGLFLPVYSAIRVFYGHPFESIEADKWENRMIALFSGDLIAVDFLEAEEVNYVFYGPREKELGLLRGLAGWQAIYDEGGIQILEEIK